MTVNANKTVRDLAVEMTSATRVFEKLGIDYCCGGHRTLAEACESANVRLETALATLEVAERLATENRAAKDWSREALSDLIDHIVSTHHAFVKSELPRIEALLAKVVRKHGPSHPELNAVASIFAGLQQELTMHLMKEEQVLFPYVRQLELAAAGVTARPASCFGTVQNPVRMMMMEHDAAGDMLREMRQLSSDFTPPADACVSYQTLYAALEGLEKDLHQHIHLENNILFPRAIEME